MLDMTTSCTIPDIIHGTIVYSGIEHEIINTPIFNRLQRISQSSLAFLTFPSNKVKRFEHSVGTMHLSGQIFYNSICNAHSDTLTIFINEIKKQIKIWRSNKPQKELPRELKSVTAEKILESSPYPKSAFYNSYLPANLSEDAAFPYFIAFEAIRIAGLLHDLGHLPYSHILENSLKNLYEFAENDNDINNDVKEEFLKTMYPFVKGKDAIHEEFGKMLVDSIKQCIVDDLSHQQLNDISYFYLVLVFDFAQKILSSKFIDNTVFADMHLIISGVVDSDRLDYCSRDYYCAALDKSIFDYTKFFQGYTLINRNVEGKKHFMFAPSAKNLSMVEELLRKRYRIYSDINYHHRVHKHEIILEKIICDLGLLELQSMETIDSLPNVLPLEVSSIWKLVKEFKSDTRWLEYQLIQMDDSWLDTLLKHKFFVLYGDSYSSIKEHGKDKRWNQFDELISTRKRYFSFIKRSSDFQILDEAFFNLFLSNNWNSDSFIAIHNKIKNISYNDFVKKYKSLFFNYVIKYNLTSKEDNQSYYKDVENIFNNNLCNNVLNCIIRSSRFGCGLDIVTSPVYLVQNATRNFGLDQLSFQHNSFLAEEALTPPFHFYYLPDYNENGMFCEINSDELIETLTNCLIEGLKKFEK